MRTLSRPMFNMGGPIKEGVMHGIREPRQSGGRTGFQFGSKGWHVPTAIGGSGAAAIVANTAQNAAKKASMFKKAGNLFAKGLPSDVQIGRAIKRGLGKVRLPGLGLRNPITFGLPSALLAKATYTEPTQVEKEYGISKREKVLAGSLPGTGGEYLPLALRRIFGERKIEVPEDRLKNITMEKGPPGGTQLPSYIDPNRASDLAKAAKDKRLNNILDIMGYDKSKSTAIHKALVDASQILTQTPGGEQLDITKDIISPIIAATGKRLEKPADIREAAGLMMAKAEIQKDLTKDETALANKALRLKIKVAEKTLAGPSLVEEYNAHYNKHGSYPSGDSLANLARTKGVDIESVIDTKTINNWLKNNKGKDEVDFMEVEVEQAKEDKTPITPGVYVVSDRIIIVGVDGTVKSHL